MARIRTIKPEFWSSPSVAGADPWVRLLFIAMWNWADDTGRGRAHVKELAAFAFPHDVDHPGAPTAAELPLLLAEIRGRFGVVFYEVDGRRFYAIPSWDTHQRNEKRAKSRYPSPEDGVEYDPTPPDQGQPERTRNLSDVPPRGVGTTAPIVGSSGPGTGEQGNRGTGETHSPTDAAVLAFPVPAPKPVGYAPEFEAAWAAYERKGSKKTAYAEWQRAIKRAPIAAIVAAIGPFVESTPDMQFRKDFERWLKGDCWESAVVDRRATNGHQSYRNSNDPNAYHGDLIS